MHVILEGDWDKKYYIMFLYTYSWRAVSTTESCHGPRRQQASWTVAVEATSAEGFGLYIHFVDSPEQLMDHSEKHDAGLDGLTKLGSSYVHSSSLHVKCLECLQSAVYHVTFQLSLLILPSRTNYFCLPGWTFYTGRAVRQEESHSQHALVLGTLFTLALLIASNYRLRCLQTWLD